jgi:hypothetical protein
MKRLILGVAIAAFSAFVVPSAQTVRQGNTPLIIPDVFPSPMIIETIFAATDRAQWGKGWFDIPAYQALGQSTCNGVALRRKVRSGGQWEAGLQMRAKAVADDMLEVTIRVSLWNPRGNHDKAVETADETRGAEETESIGERGRGFGTGRVVLGEKRPRRLGGRRKRQ